MFSHFVTAAKGLFTPSESEENLADPAGAHAAPTSEMTTSVDRPTSGDDIPETNKFNGTAPQSKRKANSGTVEKGDKQQSKRRKRTSLEVPETDEDESMDSIDTAEANAPKKHFRFGSEEPVAPAAMPAEIPQSNEDSEEDSDDDAPETIDNSAQLIKMKEQAKKQEKAKQLEEQIRKDKRRKVDEQRKLQAKSSSKAPKTKDVPSLNDDLSESTATLQGSVIHEAPRREIPALLPDDILNSEPVIRPPTPPAEDRFVVPKKSNKLRFLDKTEKPPTDLEAGDVTIRVLDAPSTKQNSSKPALAPRASKAGKNVKDNWLKRQRSTGHANGMRRTAGGPSGFVRR